MNQRPTQELETLVAESLRKLPARRAPATLQARVWRELALRAQLPWWQKSYWHWPLAARAALVLLCLTMANATVSVFNGMSAVPRGTQLSGLLGQSFGWAESLAGAMQGLQSFLGLLLRHAPTPWLYGGGLALAIVYAALLGMGTAVYRTLSVQR